MKWKEFLQGVNVAEVMIKFLLRNPKALYWLTFIVEQSSQTWCLLFALGMVIPNNFQNQRLNMILFTGHFGGLVE